MPSTGQVEAKLMQAEGGTVYSVMFINGEPWWVHDVTAKELRWCAYGAKEDLVWTLAQSPLRNRPQRYDKSQHGMLVEYVR